MSVRQTYLLRLRQPDELTSGHHALDEAYSQSLEALHGQLTVLKLDYLNNAKEAIDYAAKHKPNANASALHSNTCSMLYHCAFTRTVKTGCP